jgi:hypothetical protein
LTDINIECYVVFQIVNLVLGRGHEVSCKDECIAE